MAMATPSVAVDMLDELPDAESADKIILLPSSSAAHVDLHQKFLALPVPCRGQCCRSKCWFTYHHQNYVQETYPRQPVHTTQASCVDEEAAHS
jgi:hypothetical protein